MDAGVQWGLGVEEAEERDEGGLRSRDPQHRAGEPGHVVAGQYGPGAARRRRASVPRPQGKGDVLGSRGFQRRHAPHPDSRIALEPGAQRRRQLRERVGPGGPTYFLAFLVSSSKARMISSVKSASGAP